MALEDLTFKVTSTSEVIYDPQTLTTSTPVEITVLNNGTETISNLGLYIQPATTIGDVDYPADYPPETDYQDLMTWGERTHLGIVGVGGLKMSLPQNTGPNVTSYVTRTQGSTAANKLMMRDLTAGASAVITLTVETPPATTARRLYVTVKADIDI
jgi:hypothetical protein